MRITENRLPSPPSRKGSSRRKKIKQIEQEMKDAGFLSLKREKGKAIKLWYEVGKRLEFVMDTSVVAAEDRKFVWRAIYDHAGELAPEPLAKRVARDPEMSHFLYCYKLSRLPWELVEMTVDWTSLSDFLGRKEVENDSRIIEWLGEKAKNSNVFGKQNWLRLLTKRIHEKFQNTDTIVYSREELYENLDRIFKDIKENDRH